MAHNWDQHIHQEGFIQSKTESCLYLWHDCLIVFYTDDHQLFAKEDHTINEIIENPSKTIILRIKEKSKIIHITTDASTKIIIMTQTELVESIIKDVSLDPTAIPQLTASYMQT